MYKNLDSYLIEGIESILKKFSIKNINAHKYIAKVIIEQRKFLALSIISGLLAAFFEVISISLLFFIIKLLTSGNLSSEDFKSYK